MSSKIEQIITEIEEYIDNCKFQPLSTTKIIVNKDQMDELLRELRNDGEDVTDERGLLLAQLCGRGDVGLQNNKEMLRCQRLDVIKRQALFVLIQLLRGDLACQNAAENAVVHHFPPRFTPDAW